MSRRPIPKPGAAPHTTSTHDDEDWRHRAACLNEDAELFWPIGETSHADILQIATAKAVCRRCPVVDTCRRWALDTGQDDGVWGGLTGSERRSLKRRLTRKPKTGKEAA